MVNGAAADALLDGTTLHHQFQHDEPVAAIYPLSTCTMLPWLAQFEHKFSTETRVVAFDTRRHCTQHAPHMHAGPEGAATANMKPRMLKTNDKDPDELSTALKAKPTWL